MCTHTWLFATFVAGRQMPAQSSHWTPRYFQCFLQYPCNFATRNVVCQRLSIFGALCYTAQTFVFEIAAPEIHSTPVAPTADCLEMHLPDTQ